jgi:uncharacterized radical SAM superfamily Fe-S cluster-containing enzyme
MVDEQPATRSCCPQCRRVLPAAVQESNGAVYLAVECPEHGPARMLYQKDADFYHEAARLAAPNHSFAENRSPHNLVALENARVVAVDLTPECNLRCPMCYASANESSPPPMTSEEILSRLDKLPRKRLWIALLGGEPTLREDLPHLVREIVRMGFRLKLVTNGLRLEDPAFAAELKAQGLKWIMYQFDGFEREIYVRLRGQDLLERKLRILDTLSRTGFQISLASMIVAGVNDHQVGELIRFGFTAPNVRHITLLPASPIGRDGLGLADEHLHAEDLMDLVAEQTGGRVQRADWLATMRFLGRLHRWTGHVDFQQRVCFFSMPLVGRADDFVPAVWLTQPRRLPGMARFAPQAWYMMKHLFAIDSHEMPQGLLYLCVEKLHSARCLHIGDTAQCHTLYLTPDGLTPMCIYDVLFRGVSPSSEHG